MRGQTLVSILNRYRAEARVSMNAAHNTQMREAQVLLIQRTQERLWEDFDWPHLVIERNYQLVQGQSVYDFSEDFDVDRIFKILLKDGDVWRPLFPTLEAVDYSVWDSEENEQSWPVRRYRLYEGEKIEVWPTPDRTGVLATLDGYVKVRGVKKLSRFVGDNDRADLDDVMIALYAAAETLAAAGAKDAQFKLDAAKSRQAKLQGNLTKRRRFRMFGGSNERPGYRRPMITTYRPPE
jgi:hypothetical protein